MIGCIKEEEQVACRTGSSISFKYELNTEGINRPERIGQLSIYVFDADSLFVEKLERSTLNLMIPSKSTSEEFSQIIDLDLEAGIYTFVTVGGYKNCFSVGAYDDTEKVFTTELIRGESKLSDFIVQSNELEKDKVIDYMLNDLFIGINENVVIKEAEFVNSNVKLTLNTKTLNLIFIGLNEDDYTPVLKCNNGVYDAFNNIKIAKDNELTYLHQSSEGSNFNFSCLRLLKGVPIDITIIDRNNNTLLPIGEHDLLEYIIDYITKTSPELETQEGLDKNEEYNIVFNFDTDNVLLSIAIGSWSIVFVKPEV